MGTYTLGEAMAGALSTRPRMKAPARSGAPHRTGAPVLRDSIEAGTFEHAFFVAPAKGETDRLLRAARRALDTARALRREARQGLRALAPAERLLTTLTAAGVRVLEEILTLSRLNQGRVFPSYDHLVRATSLGRATVARSLRTLEAIGFLVRQRRFKKVESEGPGPRYAQTSNAYRTFLPKIVERCLPRSLRPAPLPEDVVHRETERVADTNHMLATLSCREFAQTVASGPLAKILARLGAALDRHERESQIDPQPLPDSYSTSDQQRWPSRPTPHPDEERPAKTFLSMTASRKP
jgi:DNA-binding transcriptional regulator YhcF (GntR family)